LKHAAILYWSNTGNTEKVAFAIKDGLEAAGVNVSILKTTEAEDIDYRDYDLICVGSPIYSVPSASAGCRVFAQKL
jgi:flavodoxin